MSSTCSKCQRDLEDCECDNPELRASRAVAAYVATKDRVTIPELQSHLEMAHRLRVTDMWAARWLRYSGWRKHRKLGGDTVYTMPVPDVIDLAAQASEPRS